MLPTPADAIGLFARATPDRIAATELSSGETWTYAELDHAVSQLATHLLERGCSAGDRIAVLAKNSVRQVMLHFACSRTALIYVPLNWRLSARELSVLIDRARPTILAADKSSAPSLASRYSMDFDELIEASRREKAFRGASRDLDRPSLILFTSGTSGKPKGVVLSERNLQQTAVNFSLLTAVCGASCFLCDAPMFHVIGLVANIRPVLQQGGSIAVSDGFEAQRTLARLNDRALGITHYVAVPQMIEALRTQPEFDAASLRRMTALVSGGAPHAARCVQAWVDDGIKLVQGFGMSEAGTVFGMPADLEIIRRKQGSVGIPAPALEVKLVDMDGNECGPGTAGEIWLRGDSVMSGYWEDQEQTDEVFTDDGWFKSGDIGRCDADGFFWILDRKKDMFISGGENVYPAEIEAVVADYPGVDDFAVIGIPDEKWGEVGCLVVVPRATGTLDTESLQAHMKEELAAYKVPKKIVTLNELPRTSTGKVQKNLLRQKLSGTNIYS